MVSVHSIFHDRSSSPYCSLYQTSNYGLWQKASNSTVNTSPLCEPVIDHPIFDILTILPFHVAPLRPSSLSVPIYPPFRSRNQLTFLLPPSLALSPLTHFGPPLESCLSPRQRMHPSARAIPSPEHTTPSYPGSWPRLQNA